MLIPSGKTRGQAAIEYMMVFGVALALSAPFIARAQGSISDLRTSSQVVQIQNSMDRLESAAETVNAAGAPAKRTFGFEVPELATKTYLLDNAVVYTLETADGRTNVSRTFDFEISGDIPDSSGRHVVSVEATDNGVEVGTG